MSGFNEWQQVAPEIRRKVLTPGANIMSMLVEFQKGGFGAEHAHPHEQLGFVVSGKVEMVIEGEKHIISAGEQVHVPVDAPHSILALEDSLVLETFTPLRQDLLESVANERKER